MSPTSERPIGYWLKAADQAITAGVDAAQRANGVTRLEWQVLNTIAAATHRSPDQIVAALHMFLDRPALDGVLTAFRSNGWIVADANGEIGLTDAGRRRVHAFSPGRTRCGSRRCAGSAPTNTPRCCVC